MGRGLSELYTPLQRDGRVSTWSWDAPDAYWHDEGDIRFVLVGAITTEHTSLPVVECSGQLYHHTPQIWRARAIVREGFSLAEHVHGRAYGDGVYACFDYQMARARGAGSEGAVVRIGVDGLVFIDTSADDGFSVLQSQLGGWGRLADFGIHGLACRWGAVLYDLSAVVSLEWHGL